MSLMIFNGSPRGVKSNSSEIIKWFERDIDESSIVYLNKIKRYDAYIEQAKACDKLLFVFPLYVDGMPAQVKYMFELMYKEKEIFEGKEVAYIIHSGFSEAVHLKPLQKYLNRFSQIMGMDNYGVFNVPGSEGFKLMPKFMTSKRAKMISLIGRAYILGQPVPQREKVALEGPAVLSGARLMQFKILKKTGLADQYWDSQLKNNKVYETRFAAPYEKKKR